MKKLLHRDPACTIEREDDIVFVNNTRFGQYDKENKRIVVHRKRIEVHKKEFGFHIPAALLTVKILFEVKVNDKPTFTHWTYSPGDKQRMLPTQPLIFISLCRLSVTTDAEHIKRKTRKK